MAIFEGFFEQLQNTISRLLPGGRPAPGDTITNTWPLWEIEQPQYPYPNPFSLAQKGYRANEVVFSCITTRAEKIAEAPLRMYSRVQAQGAWEEIADHPMRQLIRRPNEAMGEVEFWQAVEIYVDIAGFSVWEIEFNNVGEPIALWPMRPDWCAFKRGPNRPIQYVRYQPYGLPWIDVPIERCVVFMEFDPIYPMLKGLSRTAVALREITVDNSVTDFLALFFQRGAGHAGLLTTEQSLSDAEATRIKKRWRDQHGGSENWTDIAVLGNGAKFSPTSMSFKDMQFDEIDARDEVRICEVFRVPPIMISAKVGLGEATYSNYQEARKAFYEDAIFPRWSWFQSELEQQLLPHFGPQTGEVEPRFDVTDIRALQEDRTARWERAISAFEKGVVYRDRALEEMGLDPVDNEQRVFAYQLPRVLLRSDLGTPGELASVLSGEEAQAITGQQPIDNPQQDQQGDEAFKAAKELERKRFRTFAQKRIREGKAAKVAEFEFKYLDAAEQAALIGEFKTADLSALVEQLREANAHLRELKAEA